MFSSSTLTAAFQAPILRSERNENRIRRRRRSRRFCSAGHQNEKSNNFTNNKSASSDEKRYLTTKKDDSTQENESTTSLNRAISIASQSMCCIASTTGGFSNFELVARWFDLDTTTTTTTNNNNNNNEEDMNNKMGKLNERLMWKEEDTYERQMRLATASFLAATTVAVGQPALALDFVLVDPSGAFRFVRKISYPVTFRFFSLAFAYIYYIRTNTHQRYSDTRDDGLHTCSQRIHGPTRRGHVFQVQRRHDGLRR